MTVTDNHKQLLIVGATGMVGGYALRYALDQPGVKGATAIGRKPTGLTHPKLKEVLHQDFMDCSALAGALSGQDAAVFCLGVYTGAVPDAELRTITVDYAVEFARVFRGSSPNATFAFLSGSGADLTGRSRMAWFFRIIPPVYRDFFGNYPPPVLKHSATPAHVAVLPSERRAHGLSGARDGGSARDSSTVAGR